MQRHLFQRRQTVSALIVNDSAVHCFRVTVSFRLDRIFECSSRNCFQETRDLRSSLTTVAVNVLPRHRKLPLAAPSRRLSALNDGEIISGTIPSFLRAAAEFTKFRGEYWRMIRRSSSCRANYSSPRPTGRSFVFVGRDKRRNRYFGRQGRAKYDGR